MKLLFRILVPLILLGGSYYWARHLIHTAPEAAKWAAPPTVMAVDGTRLKPGAHQVVIESQGTVRARTSSSLIPEVAGRVMQLSPAFRVGGFFEKGDVLLELDGRDYEAAIIVARATLAETEARLQEEQALSDQALENWKKLGASESPSDLVLRKPQLAQARAAQASAQARLDRALRDLDRTRITAPYAGRVLEQMVDVGQYVSPGTVLGRIYAVDYAEIRLPLTHDQLAFLDLPEHYRGEDPIPASAGPEVILTSRSQSGVHSWKGRIVRAEGAFDTRSRQLFVIAQVDDPYGRRAANQPPLKVGLFVEASIQGARLQDVFAIPRSAIRRGSELLLITPESTLIRRTVEPIWKDQETAYVQEGLKAGEVLCLTPVTFAVDGIKVRATIDGVAPPKPERRGPPGAGGGAPGGPPSGGGAGKPAGPPAGAGKAGKGGAS